MRKPVAVNHNLLILWWKVLVTASKATVPWSWPKSLKTTCDRDGEVEDLTEKFPPLIRRVDLEIKFGVRGNSDGGDHERWRKVRFLPRSVDLNA